MRVVFLGSPPFATRALEHLLAAERHVVAAVVTKPDKPAGRGKKTAPSPLVELANARGIEVLQPASTKDPAFVARLRELAPDVLAVASYGEILRTEVLALPRHGCLNVHASLLPRWRGASPIQAALLAGDDETGVSIQRMVLALDEGDVLVERRTPIGPRDTSGELFERLSDLGGAALVEALDLLDSGRARFTPQEAARATYCRKINKENGVIDWSKQALELERLVRAYTPWPGARCTAPNGVEMTVVEAFAREHAHDAEPGTLVEARDALVVACGSGALAIERVKPAGKGVMEALAWQRGARVEPGARFAATVVR